jgi:hypothetical protein
MSSLASSWRVDTPGETEPLPRLMSAPAIDGTDGGALLPTVTVSGNWNRAGVSANSGDGLATAIRLLPTLTATSYGSNQGGAAGRTGQRKRMSLSGVMKTLPFAYEPDSGELPSEVDLENWTLPPSSQSPSTAESGNGLRLTPAFAEWWMGWPIGWTASAPAAMARSRSKRR